jgi:hypothetical protein
LENGWKCGISYGYRWMVENVFSTVKRMNVW